MASSVVPYFIVSPGTANKMAGKERDTNKSQDKMDENGQKQKSNKNKQIVLTRNELTRKRMDLLRNKLEESRVRYFEKLKNEALNCSRPIPRVSDAFTPIRKDMQEVFETERAETEMVPISNSGNLPYVYFVVSPENEIKSTKTKLRNKNRQKEEDQRKQLASRSTVFASKEDYGIKCDRRMMRLDSSFGLQPDRLVTSDKTLIVQKQITFPFPIKSTPKNPPTTPATTILSNSGGHYGSREFDNNDFETIYEKPVKMTIYEDNNIVDTNVSEALAVESHKTALRSLSNRFLELPFIPLDEQRKALGTAGSYGLKSLDFVRKSVSQDSSQKRVHFADSVDLPSIKGSHIALSTESLFPLNGQRALTVPDLSSEKSKSLSDFYCSRSQPETRLIHTSDGRLRKNCQSLDLPKIDIVSSVYDELIMKAIQGYIMTLPPYSKQSQVARELLEQLENKTISTADLDKEKFRSIREDIARMPRSTRKVKLDKPTVRKAPKEKCYSPLEPKCYRMVLPGAIQTGPKIKVLQS